MYCVEYTHREKSGRTFTKVYLEIISLAHGVPCDSYVSVFFSALWMLIISIFMWLRKQEIFYPKTHAHGCACKTHFKFIRMSCVSPKVVSVCDLRPLPTYPHLPEKPDWSARPGPFPYEGEPQVCEVQKGLVWAWFPKCLWPLVSAPTPSPSFIL